MIMATMVGLRNGCSQSGRPWRAPPKSTLPAANVTGPANAKLRVQRMYSDKPITPRMMSPDIIRTPTGQTVKPEQVPTLQIRLLVPSFTDAGGVLTVLRRICV